MKTVLNKKLNNSGFSPVPGLVPHSILDQSRGHLRLTNANGDIDVASAGYQYTISTLSYIRDRIIEQKFYEVAPGDFMSVDVGEAAWSDEIIQNLTFTLAGSFFEGDINQNNGNGRIAEVDAGMSPIRQPTQTWAKKTGYTIIEVAQAAAAGKWDVVEAKMKSLKKNWDLGIQEIAFLGHPAITTMTGLLNNAEVNINTTVITKKVSEMTETELTAFLRQLLSSYFLNSNNTTMPDTFVMPTDDYLGMGTPYSSTYPNISKLDYLQKTLSQMTGGVEFKIKPLVYSQSANNASRGITQNRYVLYKNNDETLTLSIPVDFTMPQIGTSNYMNWEQSAYGQYSGVLVGRPREMYYYDWV